MDCWSPSLDRDEEFTKLVTRMNPPRVIVDNTSSRRATLIQVLSSNKRGCLLELVQVLTDLKLTIRKAYISSDGEWFMDVFHVTDQHGNKLPEEDVVERIQQSLGPRGWSFRSLRDVGLHATTEHATIELTGIDRPGLLSEIFAVLTDLKCNVVAAEVWTHNSRMASVVYITDGDEVKQKPISDPDRLAMVKKLLLYVLQGDKDKRCANTAVSVSSTHTERRLHQMMYADRDYDVDSLDCVSSTDRSRPHVTIEDCADKGYTVVSLRCPDRPKLFFDTVCTLTDMQYVIFHATVIAEGPEACQEYYIRHMDGLPVNSEAERQRLIHCLEAAIKRRTSEGVQLKLCCKDRIGLLSDVTRIFRENGLSVTRAEITTRGSQAQNSFYVTDSSGDPVNSETVKAVQKEIGLTILRVEDAAYSNPNTPPREVAKFSLGNLFRSGSEKFLYNLGFLKS